MKKSIELDGTEGKQKGIGCNRTENKQREERTGWKNGNRKELDESERKKKPVPFCHQELGHVPVRVSVA